MKIIIIIIQNQIVFVYLQIVVIGLLYLNWSLQCINLISKLYIIYDVSRDLDNTNRIIYFLILISMLVISYITTSIFVFRVRSISVASNAC